MRSFERFGAPQVTRRFAKAAQRPMTGHDWAAWMAGKALVAAAHGRAQGTGRGLGARRWPSARLDGSKGMA